LSYKKDIALSYRTAQVRHSSNQLMMSFTYTKIIVHLHWLLAAYMPLLLAACISAIYHWRWKAATNIKIYSTSCYANYYTYSSNTNWTNALCSSFVGQFLYAYASFAW
jgi:hypothetical protein